MGGSRKETANTMTIRLILADDHPAMRAGLRSALEKAENIQVVGEAADGVQALALIEALRPDVALLDCHLPGMAGGQVAAEVQKRKLPTRVLPLSAFAGASYLQAMLEAGAAGYLLKDEALETVVQAVRAVARGEQWYSRQVMAEVAALAHGERRSPSRVELTKREAEVLRLMARGWDNQRIAEEMNITHQTIKNYVSRIYAKLGVTSRVEAVIRASERGPEIAGK